MRADEIAAMDHRRGALFFSLAHGLRERIGAVVTVRDDTDFHARSLADNEEGSPSRGSKDWTGVMLSVGAIMRPQSHANSQWIRAYAQRKETIND